MKLFINIICKLILTNSITFLFSQSLFSQEIKIYDEILFITEDDNGFKYFSSDSSAGINWISPYNYYNGHFEIRFEILEYTADTTMAMNVCIWSEVQNNWQSWKETCCPHVFISGRGIFTSSSIPESWWKLNNVSVNFAKVDRFERMGLVLWCDGAHNMSPWLPSEKNCWEERKLYLPIKLKLSIVAVAEGCLFSGWDSFLTPPEKISN